MSDNIFTEIYNKILGLFGQPVTKDESKNTAVNRLRLVLMQDRTNLTPEIMHRMRSELIEVLSKYVELDKEALELNFEHEGEQMALMLSIPVVRAKDEAEIQETLKKEDEEKEKEKEENDDDKSEDEDTDQSISEENDIEEDNEDEISEEETDLPEKDEIEAAEEATTQEENSDSDKQEEPFDQINKENEIEKFSKAKKSKTTDEI